MSTERVLAAVVGQPHQGRFAALEGIRAAAALGVLVFHVSGATLFNRPEQPVAFVGDRLGGICVAVFFLLSGFLIYLPFSRAVFDGGDGPDPVRYLTKRLCRIYPAYWVALIGWAAVAPAAQRTSSEPWAIFLLLDSYVPPVPALSGIGVAWTLSIEVAFYVFVLVVGVVLLRLARKLEGLGARLRLQVWVLAGMVGITQVFRVVTWSGGHRIWTNRWFVSYLDWFALGMLLAVLVLWRDRGGRLPESLTGLADRPTWCFLVAVAWYGADIALVGPHLGAAREELTGGMVLRHLLDASVAFFVLLPLTLGTTRSAVSRFCARPIPATFGVISYGIYLWHIIVIRWFLDRWSWGSDALGLVSLTALTTAVTTVLAVVSYRLIERPAMEFARRVGTSDRIVPIDAPVPVPEPVGGLTG